MSLIDYLKTYGEGLKNVAEFLAIYELAEKVATRDVPINLNNDDKHHKKIQLG